MIRRFLAGRLASRHWRPERSVRHAEDFWMAHPAVRRYINRSVTGDAETWPIDWFRQRFGGQHLGRVMVPGCGTGELERDLLGKDLCRRIDASDISSESIAEARRQAAAAGFGDRIAYRLSSFEKLPAPEAPYDACFFHHALHHLASPEEALERVAEWLAPGAILYLDEYVGPSRSQWNRRSFSLASEVYRHIPRPLRTGDSLRIPGLLAKLSDPSESIASDRILGAVSERFRILERRDYGGFLLQPLWTQIDHRPELIADLIAIEHSLAALHPPWFTVIVAERPEGPAPGI